MATKSEARRSRRIRAKIPVVYRLDENVKSMVSIGDETVRAETVNVSVLGASVASPYVLPPGIRIHIELDRKPFVEDKEVQAEPIRALAKVVGIRSERKNVRLSVMFDKIDPGDKELIAAYVERHLK